MPSGATGAGTSTTSSTAPAVQGSAGGSTSGRYLLALGDSLAAGYEPIYGTSAPPVDPADGVPDEGYPGSYAADLAQRYRLRLVDLACPGETTASVDGTPAQQACANFYKSWLGATNQLQAAFDFLGAHRGHVEIVTIDLGANDLDGCTRNGSVEVSCLLEGEADVVNQLPGVLSRLRIALERDDPGT
ncbi:MAG TPA: GDSL-type esterase/lipase family protein, partial [Acidimicrobiales bacterium]|nr:GDSL-type esterase/lipase family protein [Acidimicrobiales bacterium]